MNVCIILTIHVNEYCLLTDKKEIILKLIDDINLSRLLNYKIYVKFTTSKMLSDLSFATYNDCIQYINKFI